MSPRYILVSALLCACVPSAEDPKPRGAAGFITEPSPETRGAPFVTSDGYAMRITRVITSLESSTDYQSNTGTFSTDDDDGVSYNPVIFNASEPVDVLVRALKPGPKRLRCEFKLLGLFDLEQESSFQDIRNVSDADKARLRAGIARTQRGSSYTAAAGYIRVEARFGAELWTLDAVPAGTFSEGEPVADFMIRPDALDSRVVRLQFANLFREPTGALEFELFRVADRDGDYTITDEELEQSFARNRDIPEDYRTGDSMDSPSSLSLSRLLSTRLSSVLSLVP
jgi:hypothetical protein